MKTLVNYFLDVSKSNTAFHNQLRSVLDRNDGAVALVLSERIINMPAAVAAPSYKMLMEEIQWAIEDVLYLTPCICVLMILERAIRVCTFPYAL
jgi:protein BCP1